MRLEQAPPPPPRLCAASPDPGRKMLPNPLGNEELCVLWPVVGPFVKADFFFAERLAVGGGGGLAVRRTVADMAVQDDEGRTALGFLKYAESALNHVDVIGVADPQHVPSVTQEPGGNVLRARNA